MHTTIQMNHEIGQAKKKKSQSQKPHNPYRPIQMAKIRKLATPNAREDAHTLLMRI